MQEEHVGGSVLKPRAQRFPIRVPLEYRTSGETAWTVGKTINISCTGVLFSSPKGVEPETSLAMKIRFPAKLTGSSPVNLVCYGHVVRKDPSQSALAAAIHYSRLRKAK
jgi:hypothetical protein